MYSSRCVLYKEISNNTYSAQSDNFVPKFKDYIDKMYALCNSQVLND